MPTSSLPFEHIEAFKLKLQTNYYNFAYELLLLEMRIEQFISDKDHQNKVNPIFIQEITRLMELYMQAVEVLQSSSDNRFKYFGQKIHHLMKKKSSGISIDKKTLDQVNKAQMEIKKQQHQMQMYFHQQQVDMKRIQQLVKKSQIQASNVQGRIRNHLTSQQKTLEQRIQSRKKRSEAGSVTKFKLSGGKTNQNGFNIQQIKEKEQKAKQRDIRMEYFMDCKQENDFDESIKSPKRKLLGSAEKPQISGYQNRFAMSTNLLKSTK